MDYSTAGLCVWKNWY